MKRIILILTCLISMVTLCGCTSRDAQGFTESDIQYINRVGVKDRLVCIDGVEYIYLRTGYGTGMTPHLKADKFDNPKVIRCKR